MLRLGWYAQIGHQLGHIQFFAKLQANKLEQLPIFGRGFAKFACDLPWEHTCKMLSSTSEYLAHKVEGLLSHYDKRLTGLVPTTIPSYIHHAKSRGSHRAL